MTRAAAGRRCRGCGTPALAEPCCVECGLVQPRTPALGLVVAAGGTLFAGLLGAAALTVVLAFPLPSGTLATPARVAVVALAGLVLGDGVARSARVGIPVRPLGGFVGLFAGVVAAKAVPDGAVAIVLVAGFALTGLLAARRVEARLSTPRQALSARESRARERLAELSRDEAQAEATRLELGARGPTPQRDAAKELLELTASRRASERARLESALALIELARFQRALRTLGLDSPATTAACRERRAAAARESARCAAMRDRWVSSGLAEAKPGRDALARLDETLAALDAFDDQLLVREAALGAATSTTDESPALSSRPLPFVVDFGEALAALEVARARVLRDEKVEGELRDLEEAGR